MQGLQVWDFFMVSFFLFLPVFPFSSCLKESDLRALSLLVVSIELSFLIYHSLSHGSCSNKDNTVNPYKMGRINIPRKFKSVFPPSLFRAICNYPIQPYYNLGKSRPHNRLWIPTFLNQPECMSKWSIVSYIHYFLFLINIKLQ